MSSATPQRPAPTRESALAALGLPPTADLEQIEAARAALHSFLSDAPDELTDWARHQGADIDEAYAAALAPAPAEEVDDIDAVAAELGEDVGASTPPARVITAPETTGPKRRSPLLYLGALAVIAAIVAAIYGMGGPADTSAAQGSSPSASMPPASAAPAIDAKQVAALEAKIKANPKDVSSMRELGRMHYEARQFAEAGAWQEKILALNAKDVDAHLALGVTQLARGQADKAVEHWQTAARLDPTKAEPHYNLGFYYMSKGDTAKMKESWDKVATLAPGSDMAKNVQGHLGRATATDAPSAPAGH
ncbi:MAG: tetratricopeptide repeat protein [Micrococcales bacterium]|nr:tetratricopeptide repeat protein [Micrococcales bacterium]